MRSIKLILAYDGTDYVGWQRQARGRSIQGELERALTVIEGRPAPVHGAGRTDAGVHALAQVASLRLAHPIATPALVRALNARLPPDIRVLAAEAAAADFHARHAARRKTYRYHLASGPVASPFTRRHVWHVGGPLDVEAMREAASWLPGRRDFAAFRAVGTELISTVRTLHAVAVEPTEWGLAPPAVSSSPTMPGAPAPALTMPGAGSSSSMRAGASSAALTIEVAGDGFLRHMVRIIVGTLVEVGSGRLPASEVRAIVASRARERAGPTAPPHGLFLVAVDY